MTRGAGRTGRAAARCIPALARLRSGDAAKLEVLVKKLTVRDASGKTTRYGMSIPIDSWFVEQFSYNSDQFHCNNENGRKARATAVSFDNATALVDFWGRMVRPGYVATTGRASGDSQNLFAHSQAAIEEVIKGKTASNGPKA